MTSKLASRLILGLLAVCALAGAAWMYRDALGLAPTLGGAARAVAPGTSAVRKCVLEGQVLYSSQACPGGSREHTLGGGTVTVLPATRPLPGAGAASKPLPNVRDLLVDPRAADIKDKRMEEVIGR